MVKPGPNSHDAGLGSGNAPQPTRNIEPLWLADNPNLRTVRRWGFQSRHNKFLFFRPNTVGNMR